MMVLPTVSRLHPVRLALFCAGAVFLLATETIAQQPEPFTRVIMADGGGMQVQSSGRELVVTLDKPSKITAESLKKQLGDRAVSITPSADGKRFTVALSKPYRVRQFVSSRGAGFDVMEDTAPSVLPKPKAAPAPAHETASPAPAVTPETPKPAPKQETARKTNPPVIPAKPSKEPAKTAPEPVAPPAATETAPPPETTETKPAPVHVVPETQPAPSQPETPQPAAESPPAPEAPAITKEETPAPLAVTEKPAEEKPAEPALAPEQNEAPAVPLTTMPIPKDALAVTPEEKTAAPANEEVKQINPDRQKPITNTPPPGITDLQVGVAPKGQGREITFPWQHRVAASLFQRDRDWWLVFAAPSRIDIPQLRSVLPNNISLLEPYSVPDHTVLHFVTDGKAQLSAYQKQGRYDWYIGIQSGAASIPRAYGIEPIVDAPKPYVVIHAFDIAAPLAFTDPTFGDRLIVVPSYESEKALISKYDTPDFHSIPARQGIVIQAANEAITLTAGRDGLRISAPDGLQLSKDIPALPLDTASEAETIPNIMLPYARWKAAPEDFEAVRIAKTQALANAPKEEKAAALYDIVALYLGQGMSEEALSLINQLRDRFPAYYRENEIALLRAAANFMMFRMGDAASDIMSPEIANNPETQLWKDAISLFVPQILAPQKVPVAGEEEGETPKFTLVTPQPRFDYLAYNHDYIRYYPPKIRQKLALIAADNFVTQKEYSKASRTLETLNKDGLLMPIREYAEFLLGRIAADSGKPAQALSLWKPLASQYDDLFIHARAAFSLATLEYSEGKRSLDDTIKTLEQLRVVWRGDTLEQNLLSYLGQLYLEKKDYANALRTWKDFVNEYGASPEGIAISNKMADLFERLFGEDALADSMDPVRSLALFYEFRELSPVGERGDAIIQKLADRLAKFDLLDKASELLEHQVKFRVQGEERARLGAQLAILQLLDKKPEKALEALEISGYGTAPAELAAERNRLAALALSKVKKPEIALEMLAADRSPQGQELRLEILWDMQDWPNVVNVAEDMLGTRPNIAAPLTGKETETLLKLALAYSFESDTTQLKYLREYYTPLLKESPYKDIFEHITNDTAVLDPEDFDMVAKQISETETFLKTFKDKIAQGRLSSTIGDETPAKEEAPSLTDRNKALVPESQDTAPQKQAAEPPSPDAETSGASGPQRAPVAVKDEQPNPGNTEKPASEEKPAEEKPAEEKQPEPAKENTAPEATEGAAPESSH